MKNNNNIQIKVIVMYPGGLQAYPMEYKHEIRKYSSISEASGGRTIEVIDIKGKINYYPSNYTIITTL